MRVFINTVPLYGNGPGLRTYTAGLVRGLHESDADMEWHVVVSPEDADRLGLRTDSRFRCLRLSSLTPLSRVPGVRFAWRNGMDQLAGAAQAARCDVLHYLDSYGPVLPLRTPTVLTVHDLIPLLSHHYHVGWVRAYLAAAMRTSIPRAAAILAVSTATANQLTATMGVAPATISVVPNAVDERFHPATPDDRARIAQTYHFQAPYIACVGSISPRKNVARLVRAFAHAKRTHHLPHSLILAGGLGWQYDDMFEAIREVDLGEQIRVLGRIPDADIAPLIACASVLAYPSLEEGFGLPVVEGMACGTPVLTSAASSTQEIGGGAALLVDPTSVEEIAAGLGRLCTDVQLRRQLSAAGLLRARGYRWSSVASAAIEAYRGAAHRRQPASIPELHSPEEPCAAAPPPPHGIAGARHGREATLPAVRPLSHPHELHST